MDVNHSNTACFGDIGGVCNQDCDCTCHVALTTGPFDTSDISDRAFAPPQSIAFLSDEEALAFARVMVGAAGAEHAGEPVAGLSAALIRLHERLERWRWTPTERDRLTSFVERHAELYQHTAAAIVRVLDEQEGQ